MKIGAGSSELVTFTIYDGPIDYPGSLVVRRSVIKFPGNIVPDADPLGLAKTLADARAMIPEGLVRIPRDAADDASIVEVWL